MPVCLPCFVVRFLRRPQKGPPGPRSLAARATGPVSVGKALEARQGRDGRLCRLARCAARHSRFSRPPAGRIPRSLAPQMSKSGSHRRKWRCEIQRRPSSLDVAMVDRGQDVASLAGSDDAAARRARAGARYCLAGSGDAREKKPPRSRAAPGEGRGAITACNAPGRRSPTHFRPGRFRAARRTLRLPARATSSAGWNPSRTSAGTSPA